MENLHSLSLIITTIIAVTGWIISHQLTAWRDRINKRRELRISYLVEVFRSLSKANHHPKLYEIRECFETAIADIQLFGTEEQIKHAQKIAFNLAENKVADLDPILFSIRNELRKELGASKVNENIVWLRISE